MSHFSELHCPLTSCLSILVGRKKCTVLFARDWWRLCPHRWSLNGTLINLGLDRRRRLSGGNLIISNLDRYQDVGMYQCMAYNTVGAVLSRRASLQFACKLLSEFVNLFCEMVGVCKCTWEIMQGHTKLGGRYLQYLSVLQHWYEATVKGKVI